MKRIAPLLFFFLVSVNSTTTKRNFEFKTQFKRNPKIWGTYKFSEESITLNGQTWKMPTRVSDLVISKGHLTFVRETKEDSATKIVVQRIPYIKENKVYKNKEKNTIQIGLSRLLENTLNEQLKIKDSEKISFNKIHCTRIKSGLECSVKGEVLKL